MQNNFSDCLAEVLKHEGGYVDHPADPGGATNRGVTKKSWEEYVGHGVTKDDIKALTVEDVTPFYKKRYWDACKCDRLHDGLDYVVFDIAVNSGTGRAGKFLQNSLGVAADGIVGNGTLAALDSTGLSTEDLINTICDRRSNFYKSLPTFTTFGKGWLKRCEDVRTKALQMVK